MDIQENEIVYCCLSFKHEKKDFNLSDVVYKHTDGKFRNSRILRSLKIKVPPKVFNLKIISRLGFSNETNGFTVAKQNNEKRNKVTGAYD